MPNQQQVQTFGDISMGDGNVFTINQIIQITAAEVQTRPLNTASPYRGLQKFEWKDKDLFFGRDQLIASLIDAVTQSNLILLLGASGSGKSSVVRAGLIPQLSEKLGANFQAFIFTPDRDPFESLRISLISQGYKQSDAEIIKSDKNTLNQTIKTLKSSECQWLIFIDQFEEIFTLCQDLQKRQCFIENLVGLVKSEQQSVKIVLAMRADFLDKFSPYPAFGKVAEKNIHLVTEMHPDELRLAIEQPAATHGVIFEAGLVEEIIKDVQGQPGSLPLLQYTLDLLWQNDDVSDRVLNIKTYRKLGGVRGALQRHVDQIYQQFKPAEQNIAKQVFLRLVDITTVAEVGSKAVSRRADFVEFSADAQALVTQLIDNKLLVSNRQAQSTVEIAHETLLSSWDTLKTWIAASQEMILIRNRLCEDAKNWKKAKEDQKVKAEDELWSGSKLAQVVELRDQQEFELVGGLTETENQFIDAGVEKRNRLLQQAAQRRRNLLLATTFASLFFAGFSVFSGIQWRNAEIEQIRTMSESAKALLLSGQELDAVITSLQAARKLKHLPWPDDTLQNQVRGSLLQVTNEAREKNLLEGHQSWVTSVSFSPDGKTLATASEKTARLWDLSGKQLAEFKGHQGGVYSVSFSPDGQTLATASFDGTAKLWDLSGKQLAEFRGHQGGVYSVSFSPDGQTLATASDDDTARLWDLSGKQLAEFKGHQDQVRSVRFSPDGKTLATTSLDETVKLWDLSGKQLAEFKGHLLGVNIVSFSPNGKTLATASEKTARLWDLSGKQLAEFKGHQGEVLSVSFSPDGQTLATASSDGTAKLWDLSGKQLAEFKGHQRGVKIVSFSPNGQTLATASFDRTVKWWDLSGKQLAEFKGHQREVKIVSFSPDGQTLATASDDETVKLWDLSGKQLAEFKGYQQGYQRRVEIVSFSPDGQTLATANERDTARLWDLSGKQLAEFKSHQRGVSIVGFSPDGQTLATASFFDGTVKLWDWSGKQLAEFKGNGVGVISVSFSPDGKTLASASLDTTAKLWDWSGKQLAEFKGHQGEVLSVSFSPDGNTLATASSSEIAKLWDLSGKQLAEFRGHQGGVTSVSFSPDGKTLATTGSDGTAKLWDLSGKQLAEFRGHQLGVNSVSFSPDGKTLATTGSDGVKLWNIGLDKLVAQSCHYLRYYLNNPNAKLTPQDRHLCDGISTK